MYAGAHGLDNLVAILDNNKVQLDGSVKQILDTGDIAAKFASFGLNVIQADGHDVAALCAAIDTAHAAKGRPSIIIADTVKGNGVSYMEGKSEWHGRTPDDAQFACAFEELQTAKKAMEG
jgi:transketolase